VVRALTISNQMYELQADLIYEFQERPHVSLCGKSSAKLLCDRGSVRPFFVVYSLNWGLWKYFSCKFCHVLSWFPCGVFNNGRRFYYGKSRSLSSVSFVSYLLTVCPLSCEKCQYSFAAR